MEAGPMRGQHHGQCQGKARRAVLKDIRVARRYAAALFGVALRDGILDAVEQ